MLAKPYSQPYSLPLAQSESNTLGTALRLGDELVLNGSFDAGSANWIHGINWFIVGGNATCDGGAGPLGQSFVVGAGGTYQVEYEIAGYVAGSCTFRFSGGGNLGGNPMSSNGTFTEVIGPVGAGVTAFEITTVGFEASLTFISIREVL